MKNKRGEVATILMLGTLIVLGVTTVASTLFNTSSKKQSTSARAACAPTQCQVSSSVCRNVGEKEGSLTCCAAHMGQIDRSYPALSTSCKTNTPTTATLIDPTCTKATDVIKSGTASTNCTTMCASYGGYGGATTYNTTSRKCCCKGTAGTGTPPTGCIAKTVTLCGMNMQYSFTSADGKWCCKTDQTGSANSCTTGTEYVGGQAGGCSGTTGMCALNGKGYANKTWTDTKGLHCCCDGVATVAPSTQPSTASPASNACATGVEKTGVPGQQSCSGVCSADNYGTYITGTQWSTPDNVLHCCCKPTDTALGFDGCCKAYRPDMYGCSGGQNKVSIYARSMSAVGMTNCSKYNTNTNTSLYFACDPNKYSDGGCYAVWDGAGMTAEEKNNQANQLMNTPTPTQPPAPPPAEGCVQLGGECEIACGSVYTQGGTCTNGYCCPTTPNSGIDGGAAAGTCSKNLKCQGISPSFKNKTYSKKGTEFYTTSSCTGSAISQDELHAYCAESVFTPWDNVCIEQFGAGAYCPNTIGTPGKGFEKTTVSCGKLGRFCVKKTDEANYLQVRCSSIDPSYSSNYLVYQQNGQYYKKQDGKYVLYEENELSAYCSQNMGAIFDNGCKTKLQDATAECPLIGQKGPDYTTTNQKCGPLGLRYCVVKKKPEGNLNGRSRGGSEVPAQPGTEAPAPANGVTTDDTDVQCVQIVEAEGERFCELPTGEYLDLGPVQPSI